MSGKVWCSLLVSSSVISANSAGRRWPLSLSTRVVCSALRRSSSIVFMVAALGFFVSGVCWETSERNEEGLFTRKRVTVSKTFYDSVTVFDSGREFEFRTTVSCRARSYDFCVRKRSGFAVSRDAWFSVLTPIVTEARSLQRLVAPCTRVRGLLVVY